MATKEKQTLAAGANDGDRLTTESTRLQDELHDERIVFTFKPGRLVLESRQPRAVQLDDGRFVEMRNDGLQLISEGSRRQSGVRSFHPVKDRAMIERIDRFIEENPEIANAPNIRLRRRVKGSELAPPAGFRRWNEATPDELYALIFDFGVEPLDAMAYELANMKRPDVIMAIERAAEDIEAAEADKVNEVVGL